MGRIYREDGTGMIYREDGTGMIDPTYFHDLGKLRWNMQEQIDDNEWWEYEISLYVISAGTIGVAPVEGDRFHMTIAHWEENIETGEITGEWLWDVPGATWVFV